MVGWLEEETTYGPPFTATPCSFASFRWRSAMSRSLRAAVVAARLVSIMGR